MRRELLDRFLACPKDRTAPLRVEGGAWEGVELVRGALVCGGCGARFPVEDGIPNFFVRTGHPTAVDEAKERESKARDTDSTVYDGTVSAYHTGLEVSALLEGIAVQPGEVVVDLGAGTGRLTVELARRGATVLALDISPKSLALNRAKCEREALGSVFHVAADACALPLRSEVAAAVGSGMMIEHLPTQAERGRCLEEIRRVLMPGGRLSMTAYNYSWRKRRHHPREGFHGDSLYFYNLDSREMRNLLRGYDVHTVSALLNLPRQIESPTLDRWVSRVPPLALLTGQLLWVVAGRSEARA